MSEKTIDVIGLANPHQDMIAVVEKLPETNTNCRLVDYCFQGGGNIPTALAVCGMLGLKTTIVGVLGDDILGRLCIADFEYNHVDTSNLIVDKGKRTNFCISVNETYNKGKEFISKGGDFHELQPSELDEKLFKSAKILHIGILTDAAIQACKWMHESGGKVSIDAAYYRPDIYENYKHLDIFIGSETYYDAMVKDMGGNLSYEEAMRAVQKQGPEIVIFTFGPDGSRGVYGDKYFEIPALETTVVDTTGAGDVYHGGFDYAYLQGWDALECAKFASGVSAIKCTRMGGRAGIPTLEHLQNFLKTGVVDDDELDKRVFRYKYGLTL